MDLRIPNVQRGEPVTLSVNGDEIQAYEGESVAAALWAAGIRTTRVGVISGSPRGALCFMGLCQDCLVQIDGEQAQSCLVPVRDGITVTLATTP
jgi:predicted molibdopterin-dependent oxidoreductase YjgC